MKMKKYAHYTVKVNDYKGKKQIRVTDNFFDKSDYAFFSVDGSLTSYSDKAVDFVRCCLTGVEELFKQAVSGSAYIVYTNGVYGKTIGFEKC
jgi:hypothetical protein